MFRSIVSLIFAPMIVISNALITSAQNRDEAQIRALQERQAADLIARRIWQEPERDRCL